MVRLRQESNHGFARGSSHSEIFEKPVAKGDPEFARRVNRYRILRLLREDGASTRSEIASKLSLSKVTVSTIVSNLIGEGTLAESGRGIYTGGRSAIPVDLNTESIYVVGIDIGRSNTTVAVSDLKAQIVAEKRVVTASAPSVDQVVQQVKQTSEELTRSIGVPTNRIVGGAVSIPGMVNRVEGIVLDSPGFSWNNIPFSAALSPILGYPLVIDNCSRAMALAEINYGAARGCENMLYINVGSGVGSALVLNGHLYDRHSEMGHIRVVDSPYACDCGKTGCLQAIASGRAIELRANRETVVGRTSKRPLSSTQLAEIGIGGDEEVLEIYSDAGHSLGKGAAFVANVFFPNCIVIGGGVALAGDLILQSFIRSFKEDAVPLLRDTCNIDISTLGLMSGAIGAVTMALDTFVFDTAVSEK